MKRKSQGQSPRNRDALKVLLRQLRSGWKTLAASEKAARLQKALASGLSQRQIARKIGITESGIRYVLRERKNFRQTNSPGASGPVSVTKSVEGMQPGRLSSAKRQPSSLSDNACESPSVKSAAPEPLVSRPRWTQAELVEITTEFFRCISQCDRELMFMEAKANGWICRQQDIASHRRRLDLAAETDPRRIIAVCELPRPANAMAFEVLNHRFEWFATWSQILIPDASTRYDVLVEAERRLRI